MKIFAPLLLALVAFFAPGCSDDEIDIAKTIPPPAEEACANKDGCSDAGTD